MAPSVAPNEILDFLFDSPPPAYIPPREKQRGHRVMINRTSKILTPILAAASFAFAEEHSPRILFRCDGVGFSHFTLPRRALLSIGGHARSIQID
jgi:hypothetical protein